VTDLESENEFLRMILERYEEFILSRIPGVPVDELRKTAERYALREEVPLHAAVPFAWVIERLTTLLDSTEQTDTMGVDAFVTTRVYMVRAILARLDQYMAIGEPEEIVNALTKVRNTVDGRAVREDY
jgi:hypothetical protein